MTARSLPEAAACMVHAIRELSTAECMLCSNQANDTVPASVDHVPSSRRTWSLVGSALGPVSHVFPAASHSPSRRLGSESGLLSELDSTWQMARIFGGCDRAADGFSTLLPHETEKALVRQILHFRAPGRRHAFRIVVQGRRRSGPHRRPASEWTIRRRDSGPVDVPR